MSDIYFFRQAQISLLRLPQPKAKMENSLGGQMRQRGLLEGFKRGLCQLVQHQGEVPGGEAPPTFRSVSVEAIHETSEIFIFADIER